MGWVASREPEGAKLKVGASLRGVVLRLNRPNARDPGSPCGGRCQALGVELDVVGRPFSRRELGLVEDPSAVSTRHLKTDRSPLYGGTAVSTVTDYGQACPETAAAAKSTRPALSLTTELLLLAREEDPEFFRG